MAESVHLRSEYLALKDRVQSRIHNLESKFYQQPTIDPSQTIHLNVPPCQPHSLHQTPHLRNHHHHCYCSHSCHRQCSNSGYSNLSAEMKNNPSQNFSINEALLQNLRAQKQMNNNLKLLNDKISDISAKKSEISNFIEEPICSQNRRSIYFGHEESGYEVPFSERSKSETGSRNKYGIKFKKNESKNILTKKKSPKKEKQWNNQYYNKKLHKGCPVHDRKDIEEIYQSKLKNRQVYKDSAYRNRNHERNHLVNAYKQQTKSRKELLGRLSKNIFQKKGVK